MKRFCEEELWTRRMLAGGESRAHATTIDSLPDNVLLDVFNFCRMKQLYGFHFHSIWDWHRLAQICSRWRRIIFSSPCRLDLQLLCTYGTPVRNNLSYWPPFPLIVDYSSCWSTEYSKSLTPSDEDNVVAALENSARVHYIGISVTSLLLGKMASAMRKPFPALTHLWLSLKDANMPALPDEFLGGSAPALQVLHLKRIRFPALPALLSSALGLVELRLLDIPHDGYISPEAIIKSLAALTGLRVLFIGFKSPTRTSRTAQQDPVTRTVLPSLTTFEFHGVKEYLEDLIAQIDAPRLDYFRISYFNQLDFHIPHLSKFICRTQNLSLARFKRARVDFGVNNVDVSLYGEREEQLETHFSVQISCQGLDWQVSHVAQILSQSGAMLSNVSDLSMDGRDIPPGRKDFMDDTKWLDILRIFTAGETLHVTGKLAEHIARGFEGATEEMVAEVLPSLLSLCLEPQDEPFTYVERFVAIRQLSGRPVTILDSPGGRDFFETFTC